ncbi:MAG TPA: DHA2 family efflux MFS transporter permease subunit, partial [Bryobacteraceae bacterium]|nr:DHA2 family efflux MFS transporter permease subunit [Bryobacteraceae bacterium]
MNPTVSHRDWKPSHNPWSVALTVTLATFMEVLDSSIANVSLPHIAGSLGATYDEAIWILTSYLVSAAIVLPASAWLSTIFGRKRFYMTCVMLFTCSSFLCGIAPNLPFLIVARILQGAGGGGLQPSEQAILADTFPLEKRGQAFSVYGMAVVFAPAIGPTLGGWITDNINWHWIFFINLPVGLMSLFFTSRLVEDPPWLKSEKRSGIKVDYIGLSLLVIGIACFQFVLDKGQESDWFASRVITALFMIGIPMLAAFFLWEWYHPHPIVDVRLLKNRNFGTAVSFSFILGMVLFGSTVLIPEFLQSSLGYTAERAGLALSPAGFVLMFMMVVAGRLVATKIDPRLLICIGFLGTSFALRLMTNIYLQIDFTTIVLLRMFQVIFMPLIFIPITTLNYIGVPREKNNQVSGISSFMRNIGGSIGTSMLSVFLTRQNQTHLVAMASHTSTGDSNFQQFLNGLTGMFMSQGYDAATAAKKALAMAYYTVQSQANALSFKNSFFVMSIIIACLAPLPFIMRRPKPGERQPTL